jgi:DegV family protein with EDD domain
MVVKILTDSTSDIPAKISKNLDITIVPVYVYFGLEEYKDGVNLTEAEFYKKLATSRFHPSTSQPSPNDFAEEYNRLAENADGIVSVVISSKISGVYNSAIKAKERLNVNKI